MARAKFAYVERKIDEHGIERIYGYTSDGQKYFLNLHEVIEQYERRGIRSFRRCS